VRSAEVHGLDDVRLAELVGRMHQESFNLRFQHATGQLEDTAALRRAKRDLARAVTVARERGLDVDAELRKQRETK
jgi:large subunit ribosomal protein L29